MRTASEYSLTRTTVIVAAAVVAGASAWVLLAALAVSAVAALFSPACAADDPATAPLAELAMLLPCAQPDTPLEECVTRDATEHWLLGHEGAAYLAYDWACVDVRAGGRTCVRAPMAPRLEPAR